MISYPVFFSSQATAETGTARPWQIQSGDMKTFCTIPVEFDGPGNGFSPEDLFAQALTNCFVATFKVMAERSKVSFERLEANGLLTVDRNEKSQPTMKSFLLQIRLTKPSHPERASTLVKKAMETGFILNSVLTLVDYNLEIV